MGLVVSGFCFFSLLLLKQHNYCQCIYFSRFSIISSCWKEEPEERPTFSDLVQEISSVLEAEAGYLDLSSSLAWKKEQVEETREEIQTISQVVASRDGKKAENVYETAM